MQLFSKYKMTYQKLQKVAKIFRCNFCDYECSNKYNFNKHLTTDKHKILTNTDPKVAKNYKCECGKEYKHKQSLTTHKKICKFLEKQENNNNTDILIKKIEELEKTIKDNPSNQVINNTTNTTKNSFNLNIFLNEKCRDAINIVEFREEVLKAIMDVSDVLNITNTDSITNAVNVTYNNLDEYEKPYYSLDKSRQQMIIKNDKNEWVKDKNILYNIVEPLTGKYTENQLNNFYKKVDNKNNLNESQEKEFTEVILNTTCDIDKEKLVKKVINNGLNPKSI